MSATWYLKRTPSRNGPMVSLIWCDIILKAMFLGVDLGTSK